MTNPDRLFSLDGHVAVVTGALGNLGPVWVETLLDAGAKVLGIDLPGAEPNAAFKAVQQRYDGSRLALASADVRDREALEQACTQCRTTFGVPSVLVNNAGIDQPPVPGQSNHRVDEMPYEISRAILEVNVLGLFQTAQVFGREMANARRGSIINMGSLYASVSPDARLYSHMPGDPPFLKPPAYGASKAAVLNLTKYLAAHWGPYGVRVNALSPGGVLGGQDEEFQAKFGQRVPLGRMGRIDEMVGPLLFLASDASSYVNGINLQVDGGFTAW